MKRQDEDGVWGLKDGSEKKTFTRNGVGRISEDKIKRSSAAVTNGHDCLIPSQLLLVGLSNMNDVGNRVTGFADAHGG